MMTDREIATLAAKHFNTDEIIYMNRTARAISIRHGLPYINQPTAKRQKIFCNR